MRNLEYGHVDKVKCPRCGSDKVKSTVKAVICADAKHFGKRSKSLFRDFDTSIYSIDWRHASFFCIECSKTWKYNL